MQTSAGIRSRLNHPVIDGDGHTIEYLPVVLDFMREIGGPKIVDKYLASTTSYFREMLALEPSPASGWNGMSAQERRDRRVPCPGSWGLPTANTLDRATVMLPALFRKRLDEFGIDFAVVYTTMGLSVQRIQDEDVRRTACRALNTMYAELYGPHADRMTPVALIPTFTPEEALDELDYAVGKLGLKAITLGTCVRRAVPEVARNAPELSSHASWMDVLAHDSAYDYDPVWAKCAALNVVPTAHSSNIGWGNRASTESFVYNHIGHFAAAGEAFCKALVLGGVMRRFPTLRFAFLEGGAGWACNLYNDLIEHWETRNTGTMRQYLDPAKLDRKLLRDLFATYGGARFDGRLATDSTAEWSDKLIDDWAASGVRGPEEIRAIFERFYFGCEAEDRMTALAFNPKVNHFGAKLQAFFSSDVGHFDVRDMASVLARAYELVEEQLLTSEDFRDFTFTNVAKLYASVNPDFFKGTVVEDAVAAVLAP